MSSPKKAKATVIASPVFPLTRGEAAPGQFTLDQVKKYASPKPLRRPEPRKKTEDGDKSEG